ncbi:hypothetical protein LOAG_03539 [Loa loa]|uniref:Uncharacterized protein n=1 Tax=Loa loa TaxID=7209 RepID=A0A1S0U605_LOALO|nr:hypothetical protein LOAG_03539 [Loa loa]EFO24948.1 hypothetical protein LOAG_03539 [Loa loa]
MDKLVVLQRVLSANISLYHNHGNFIDELVEKGIIQKFEFTINNYGKGDKIKKKNDKKSIPDNSKGMKKHQPLLSDEYLIEDERIRIEEAAGEDIAIPILPENLLMKEKDDKYKLASANE